MFNIGKLLHPTSVAEASKMLLENEGSMIIAGGTDVLIQIRDGHLKNKTLVSIHRLDELRGIQVVGDEIQIGALTTFNELKDSPILNEKCPIMFDATKDIGGPQLRHSGTVGGNLSNGITSADTASSLLTLNASVEIDGPNGPHRMPLTEFYISHATVKLEAGEIVTKVIINEKDYEGFNGEYIKYAPRKAMDIAVVGCAVNLKLAADKKTVEDIRFAFGACSPVPMRATDTENHVIGKELTAELVQEIGEHVSNEVNPRNSWKGSREFRVHIAQELAKRVFKSAVEKAGGVING